jgi:ammonia channel protein AmtB
MSASLILGTAMSTFVYHKAVPRDFLNSLIAGGVAACSAGYYFTNPVWAMVLGSTCGIVQGLVQGLIEKKVAMNNRIFHTYSFTLFGVQGLIGAVFASIFRKVVETRTDDNVFSFAVNSRPAGFDLAIAAISAGIGLGFGLLIGLIVLCSARHIVEDHFDDYTYWVPDDGIRYPRQVVIIPPVTPIVPIVPPPAYIPESELYVKETTVNVKNKHAYL